MITKSVERILAEAVSIEEEAAKEAGALGFMARAMVQATLPHSKPKGNEFRRKNGDYLLTMYSPHGLPYGTIPRLLLCWLTTEAVRTQESTLTLGNSLSEFMEKLGLCRSGGSRGDITRLREQMRRLFASTVYCSYSDKERDIGMGFQIIHDYNLWWHPQQPDQAGLWESSLTISEKFFKEITQSPVPIDMRALKALRRSPLALDLYVWLTYRMSYLKDMTVIPWHLLAAQFGADYGRERDFKEAFGDALRKVTTVYSGASVEPTPKGLQLKPSRPHIAR